MQVYRVALTCRPSSEAFLATRAAPSITLGLDVFVQLVIAAITTLPCLSSAGCPWKSNLATLSCTSFGTANPCIKVEPVALAFPEMRSWPWILYSHKFMLQPDQPRGD